VLIQLDEELPGSVDVGALFVFDAPRIYVSVCEASGQRRFGAQDSSRNVNPLEWKHVCAAHLS